MTNRLLAMLFAALLAAGCGGEEKPATPATGEGGGNKAMGTVEETTEEPGEQAPDNAADAQSTAEDLIAQAMQLIGDNKLDQANDILAGLQGMRDTLPAEWQKRIDDVATALKAKKAAGGVKLPGMGG